MVPCAYGLLLMSAALWWLATGEPFDHDSDCRSTCCDTFSNRKSLGDLVASSTNEAISRRTMQYAPQGDVLRDAASAM
jgi:hypothetical protein